MAGPGGTFGLTNGDDTFPGVGDDNSGDETISGLLGNDLIFGGFGNDILNGNEGNDILDGGAHNDTLNGNDGNDTISDTVSGPGTTTIDGGADDDTITLNANFTSGSVAGGSGSDILNPLGNGDISTLVLSGLEFLHTNGAFVAATAAQFDAFDTIRVDAANPLASVQLFLANTGAAQSVDLSDELASGGGPRGVILTGSNHDDTVTGGAANDTLNGSFGNDTLNGGLGIDTLIGGVGDDTLNGGAGNDIIEDSGATTTIDGGADDDTITLNANFVSGSVAGNSGSDTLVVPGNRDISALTLSGLEFLHTEAGFVTATAAQFDGFNTIRVNAANAGTGVQLVLANTGAAQSADLSDELASGGGPRSVAVTGSNDNDTITLGSLDDFMSGGFGNDTINGGLGNDNIQGNAGVDTLNGGAGNDLISDDGLGPTATSIDAGADDDLVAITAAIASGTIAGGTGNDRLSANNTNLSGITLSGFEFLDTNSTNVTATAAQFEAFDTIRVESGNLAGAVYLTLAATGGPQIANLLDELNSGGGPRDATVDGSSDDDTIITGGGNDTLRGFGGADVLAGGAGNDFMDGGTNAVGRDFVDYTSAAGGVTVDLRILVAQNTVGAGTDTLIGIEGVIGSLLSDTIDGDDNDNSLSGLDGNDTLRGNGGADIVIGLAGNDTLRGGLGEDDMSGNAGNDNLDGEGGNDTIDWSDATGAITVTLNGTGGGSVTAAGIGTDTFSNFENMRGGSAADSLAGNAGANEITGNAGADVLFGLGGNDTLRGGNDADKLKGGADNDTLFGDGGDDILEGGTGTNTMHGGAGNDTFYVEGTTDSLVEAAGEGNVDFAWLFVSSFTLGAGSEVENLFARLSADTSITGNELANRIVGFTANDTLTGAGGNDVLEGRAGGDSLFGGAGNDKLYGEVGDDTLRGGLGFDQISCGTGNDTVRYETADYLNGEWDNVYGFSDAGGGDSDILRLQGVAGDYTFTDGAGFVRVFYGPSGAAPGTAANVYIYGMTAATLADQILYF